MGASGTARFRSLPRALAENESEQFQAPRGDTTEGYNGKTRTGK